MKASRWSMRTYNFPKMKFPKNAYYILKPMVVLYIFPLSSYIGSVDLDVLNISTKESLKHIIFWSISYFFTNLKIHNIYQWFIQQHTRNMIIMIINLLSGIGLGPGMLVDLGVKREDDIQVSLESICFMIEQRPKLVGSQFQLVLPPPEVWPQSS